MAPTRLQLLETAMKVIDGLRSWTLEDCMSYRTSDCIHQILPSSLNRPPMNNDELSAWIQQLMPLTERAWELTIDDARTVIDEATRRVVLYAEGNNSLKGIGLYEMEYIFSITVNEDGTLVEKIDEFVDSQTLAGFTAQLGPGWNSH